MDFQRLLVPLLPGEERAPALDDPCIDGLRLETDAEFRARIVAKLKPKLEPDPDERPLTG